MNLGSVIIVCVRSKNFLRGRIVEANCILESTPPPHFGLDVLYKMGGRINGTLRYFKIYLYTPQRMRFLSFSTNESMKRALGEGIVPRTAQPRLLDTSLNF